MSWRRVFVYFVEKRGRGGREKQGREREGLEGQLRKRSEQSLLFSLFVFPSVDNAMWAAESSFSTFFSPCSFLAMFQLPSFLCLRLCSKTHCIR